MTYPRLAALAVIPVLVRMHLSVTVAGGTVTVAVPWLLAAAFLAAVAGLGWLTVRQVRAFRSSPWPRPARGVPAWPHAAWAGA